MTAKTILLERIYDDQHQQGYRVLVDRLWPRGVTKERAKLDEWCKALAPSSALRTWFGHKPERWDEFRKRYGYELEGLHHEAHALLQRAGHANLVLVYGAKDSEHAHVLVLKTYLQGISSQKGALIEMTSPVCYAAEFDTNKR